jgi:wyosine [tRNA(Phe)-imidazoG37] synthetase (radical SAM superfamily)
MRRDRYVPEHGLIEELKMALEVFPAREIDWVTFVGSGETLLHAKIGWMLREVKAMTDIPVAVITNGSLLWQPYVRWELEVADAVLPSLDVGTDDLYQRINRPHRRVSFERHVEGLMAFRNQYHGRLWVEVMLVQGLNDGERELAETAHQLKRVRPDEIHLNGPTRSPVEPWVAPPATEAVIRACKVFESVAPVRVVHSTAGKVDLDTRVPIVDAVADVVTRHPLRREELVQALHQLDSGDVQETITQLEASGRLQVVIRGGSEYWVSAATHFPSDAGSNAAIGAR